jgi:hypothetical protein
MTSGSALEIEIDREREREGIKLVACYNEKREHEYPIKGSSKSILIFNMLHVSTNSNVQIYPLIVE